MDNNDGVVYFVVAVIILLVAGGIAAVLRNRWLDNNFPRVNELLTRREVELIDSTKSAFEKKEQIDEILKLESLYDVEKVMYISTFTGLQTAVKEIGNFCDLIEKQRKRYRKRPVWLKSDWPETYLTWSGEYRKFQITLLEISNLRDRSDLW